jgi:tetratricopeptide (TPR) repeat protein
MQSFSHKEQFKNFCILFFIVQFTLSGLAQTANIDSLKKALSTAKGSAQIDCLNGLSKALVHHQTGSAETFAQEALKEAEKINYKKGMAGALINLAWAHGLSGGDLPTMESYCRKAVLLLENTDEKEQLADAWFSLACAQSSQCKFSFSIDAFDKAGQLFFQAGDELGLAKMYDYMGEDERNRGQYSKSLAYAVKWLDIAKKYNDRSYIDIWASLYKVVGDYETALDYYSQGAEILKTAQQIDHDLVFDIRMKGEIFLLQEKYDSAGHYFALATQYMPQGQPPLNLQWGTLYLARKKYDSALLHLNKALTRSKTINDLAVLQPALLNLSKAYKEIGNTQMAILYARELLKTAAKTGARQNTRDGHYMLYQLFAESGNRDSAFKHLQKYTTLKDIIDKDLSAQKLAFYKIKSEKEKDQGRINLLNEEKKLQQLRINQTAQQKKFLIAGIAALCLISVVFLRNIILKRKNEKQRFEHELEIQTLESEKTKTALQQRATELEMQALRAQMNPHFIFNSLNSINRFILQNSKLQASEYLTKFSRLIRLILQNSQASLIPLESELESLQLYLELEMVRFDHHFDFKITVDDELDSEFIKVPPLIIQPYAENAIWHGLMQKEEKGHLDIELSQNEEILFCKITDDGIGRERAAELKSKSAPTHKSMGMQITANRIAMLQQKKRLDTSIKITDLVLPDGSAGGTEVLLKIPLIYA